MLRLHHVFPYDPENSWPITANVSSFPTDCLPRDEAAAWLPFREDREILNFRRTEGGIRLAFFASRNETLLFLPPVSSLRSLDAHYPRRGFSLAIWATPPPPLPDGQARPRPPPAIGAGNGLDKARALFAVKGAPSVPRKWPSKRLFRRIMLAVAQAKAKHLLNF
jgi:hypothetical protein